MTAPELGADLTVGVSRRQQQNHARPFARPQYDRCAIEGDVPVLAVPAVQRTHVHIPCKRYGNKCYLFHINGPLVLGSAITVAFERRCIPPGGVAHRSNTPGIFPLRLLAIRAPRRSRCDTVFADQSTSYRARGRSAREESRPPERPRPRPLSSRPPPPSRRPPEPLPPPPSLGASASSSSALRDKRILPEGSMLTTFTRTWSPSFTSAANVLHPVMCKAPRRGVARRCPEGSRRKRRSRRPGPPCPGSSC